VYRRKTGEGENVAHSAPDTVRFRGSLPAVTKDPLFYAAVLLSLLGAATVAIRPANGIARRLIQGGGVLFVIAGVLLVTLVRSEHDFRVTTVQVVAARDYVGPCPGCSASALACRPQEGRATWSCRS
jgi:protein-S-isoprenylcysteine O-methyltransferase Ste14